MCQQPLANKALHWGLWCLSLQRPQKGQRLPSPMPPSTSIDPVLAQRPVHGDQISFTLWTTQFYQIQVITGSEGGNWCIDSWCRKSSHQQRAREMATMCGLSRRSGKDSSARSTSVRCGGWQVCFLQACVLFLALLPSDHVLTYFFWTPPFFGKIRQSYLACICHRIKWYVTCVGIFCFEKA